MDGRKRDEVRREIPEVFRELERRARTSKKEWKWQRGIVEHPLSGSRRAGVVATDGSLLGNAGKWRACGWTEVQLDYDEEMGPLHGMYGSMEAEYEVQRTIKRAELTAFLCLLRKCVEPIMIHMDNKGIIDGLRKGEKECIMPRAGDAELWIKM